MRNPIPVLCMLVAVCAVVACRSNSDYRPARDKAEPAQPGRLDERGVRGRIEVGTWSEMDVDTPEWIFPMVRVHWGHHSPNVASYSNAIVQEIRSRPEDQPIWLQTQGWFGRAKPPGNRDSDGLVSHLADSVPSGTPGIWPERGRQIWLARQRELVERLHQAGARIDGWPLANEVSPHRWSRNFYGPWVFREIVRDPRWKTEPIRGVGIPGARVLDPGSLDPNVEPMLSTQGGQRIPDDPVAYEYAMVLGQIARSAVFDEVLTESLSSRYPNVWSSDYNAYTRPIEWDKGLPAGLHMGDRETWSNIRSAAPNLEEIPGVGTYASMSLYGGVKWRRDPWYGYREGDDLVDTTLRHIKRVMEIYGGADRVIPWICEPHFIVGNHFDSRRDGQRAYSDDEYERLLAGLVDLGIRRFILWNSEESCAAEQRRTVEALQRAHRRAVERDEAIPSQRDRSVGGRDGV